MTITRTLASLLAAGAMATAANAADLNSSCCADLEERVAELEATVARKGNRKVSLTLTGQVNWAIIHTSIDSESETKISNNPNSQSRFGFVGEAKISQHLTAGYILEIGTAGAGFDGAAAAALNVRHSALWLAGPLGKVTLGHTSSATDGIAEISIANVAHASTLLSLEPLSGTWLGGLNLPIDGNRTQVLKYETPEFAGFTIALAWLANVDNSWDAALRYAGEFGGFKLAAGLGYRQEDMTKTVATSASIMHVASGIFLNGAYGETKDGMFTTVGFFGIGPFSPALSLGFDKLQAMHIQGGIEQKWFSIGKSTLYAEWLQVKLFGDTTDGWGVGFVQSIEAANMDLYLGYRRYDDFDVQVITAGGVIRF